MSADRDMERLARSWLQEERHENANRVLDIVLDLVDTTPQRRRPWLVWRSYRVNTATRIAVAAVAVVVLALAGARFLLPSTNTGGPSQATPTPTTHALPLPASGDLAPGTYRFSSKSWTPVPFTFVVPAGWTTDKDGFIRKHADREDEVGFSAFIVTDVYANACHWNARSSLVDAGTTVDDLANALAAQKERQITGPSTETLGGYPAKRISLFELADFDAAACDQGIMRQWPDPGPDENGGKLAHAYQVDVVWIVDVNGTRVVIDEWHNYDQRTDLQELDRIILSIRFEP